MVHRGAWFWLEIGHGMWIGESEERHVEDSEESLCRSQGRPGFKTKSTLLPVGWHYFLTGQTTFVWLENRL